MYDIGSKWTGHIFAIFARSIEEIDDYLSYRLLAWPFIFKTLNKRRS